MDEGIFTLIFILFMVAASVLDAVGRRKKKKRRMEEMEAEDEVADTSPGEVATRRREEGRGGTREGRGRPGPERAAGGRDPQSAETMVPEDLWAILTGQPPRDRSSAEPEDAGPAGPEEWSRPGSDDPGREPDIPVPVPQDRMSTSRSAEPASTEEAAPTRRSARWMEGTRGREESESWAGGTIQEEESRIYDLPEEPWGGMDDISSEDLTTTSGQEAPPEAAWGTRTRRPSRPRGMSGRGRYTRLLATGSVDDLRKAIVLREVLGPPIALKDESAPGRW